MKKYYLLVLIVLFHNIYIYSQNLDWAIGTGGGGIDQIFSSVIDDFGNIYSTGNFYGTVDFDPSSSVNNLISAGIVDIYIQKVDANGNLIWAKRMGGIGIDYGVNITINKWVNQDTGLYLYVTGSFRDTVDFDPGNGVLNLNSKGASDIFIQKFDNNGDLIWVKSIGGLLDDEAFSTSIDISGNVYTTGYFKDTVDFDPGTGVYNLISEGDKDIFILKLNKYGDFVWAKRMGNYLSDEGKAIELDSYGNIYTSGYFKLGVDFDPNTGINKLMANSKREIFLQKLDSNGNYIWAKKIGGKGEDEMYDMRINDTNIYFTGYFSDSADFDPSNSNYYITASGGWDIFILKLDINGSFKWVKSMGCSNYNCLNYGYSIAYDADGNVYTSGSFSGGNVDFDPGVGVYPLTPIGLQDAFMLKLDSNGNFIWVKQFGINGVWSTVGGNINIDKSNNIYFCGLYQDTIDVDPGSGVYNLINNGSLDFFILKLNQNNVGFQTKKNKYSDINKLTVIPNPNNGEFSIDFNTRSNKKQSYVLSIYSSIGLLVYTEKLDVSRLIHKPINLKSLNSGMYFITLKSNEEVINAKVIIE